MLRNDYRRALIMFRSLEQGYSGHARLERRTLMGTLCLTACAPGAAALCAALAGRRGNDYFAAPLGALRRDSRGQYSLIASFDPRNIEGRELEEYQLLVIVDAGDPCRLVLSGNVCGSVQMDWERVRRAACALFVPGANARAGQSAEDQPLPAEDAPAAEPPSDNVYADAPAVEPSSDNACADAPAVEPSSDIGFADAPAVEPPSDSGFADAPAVEPPSDNAYADAPAVEPSSAAPPAAPPAGEHPLDPSRPWPQPFEAVRALFSGGEWMEEPPLAGYAFVRASLTDSSAAPWVAIGVRAEDGMPVQVVYAFPADEDETPPAGLEDCIRFSGAREWWLRFEPAQDAP